MSSIRSLACFVAMFVLATAMFGLTSSFAEEPLVPDATDGVKQAESVVSGALKWLARHQNADGSWSLNHTAACKDGGCTCPGDAKSDSAATALALLPFLAAGQTHDTKGPHKAAILKGLNWLLTHQKQNGDLSAGGTQMYSHGIAAIALCESYGATRDSRVGFGAQAALNFIMTGQSSAGGWRYVHASADSDMSVTGWQVSALKSGQLAGLKVKPEAWDGVRKYLDASAKGDNKERFSYVPSSPPSLSMTATGLLVSQYLGAKPDSPAMAGGAKYLLASLPDLRNRNCYYWYYGTQVMQRMPEESRVKWTNAMRRVLTENQEKEKACAAGSWDPEKPQADVWGRQGGRLMVTALSALTLEVYYRHIRLFGTELEPEKKE